MSAAARRDAQRARSGQARPGRLARAVPLDRDRGGRSEDPRRKSGRGGGGGGGFVSSVPERQPPGRLRRSGRRRASAARRRGRRGRRPRRRHVGDTRNAQRRVRAGRPPGTRAETPAGARARDERERPPRAVLDGEASRRGFRDPPRGGGSGRVSLLRGSRVRGRARSPPLRVAGGFRAQRLGDARAGRVGCGAARRRDRVRRRGPAAGRARAPAKTRRALWRSASARREARRNEPTPQQRIQAKLNQMKRGKRRVIY